MSEQADTQHLGAEGGDTPSQAETPASESKPSQPAAGSQQQPPPNMDGEESADLRGFTLAFGLAELVGALAVILMAVWMGHFQGGFAWQSDPAKEFNWHPVLMSFSLIFLYGNAILIYRVLRTEPKKKLKLTHALLHILSLILVVIGLKAVFDSHNLSKPPFDNMYSLHSWLACLVYRVMRYQPKPTLKRVHAALQIVLFCAAVVGLKAAFDSHDLAKPKPIPNLYSLHSWLGIVTAFLFAWQWLAGLISFLFPGLRAPLRRAYMPIHYYFGLAIFLGAVATALMGILEKAHWAIKNYGELPPEAVLVNCTGMLLVTFAGLVVYLVANPRFKRRPLPEDEMLLTDTIGE